ncbi:MAG TPA: DUF3857 domain-containing protein [Bacteroidia bacterium]|nr:DUF3857 domain-containing protein [Bacteroidia bacterium]
MMKKIKLLTILSVIAVTRLSAQDYAYKKYSWEANPKIHQLTAEEKEGNYITLKEKRIYEYAYEASGDLVLYETIHKIVHLNNEKGIEEMNKIYIPYAKILEEMDLKARTITPGGKIIQLAKNSIKKVDNLENLGAFIIFAMEGVEKDAEIEYIYTNKKSPNLFFTSKMQGEKIQENVSIDIFCPDNLTFEARGYNGFPEFTSDTTVKEKNHIFASIAKIDALNDEKYSFYESNKMRFDVQLTYNTAKGKSRLYSWESAGVQFHSTLFSFTKQELKAIDKLISKLGLEKQKTDEAKIQMFEQWVKSNIGNKETGEDHTLDKVLEVKYSDDFNLQRLYIGAAQQLNVPFEVVITSDRENRKFDSKFPSYNSLQEYLIYFPTVDKYLSSTNYSSRLGYPPPTLAGGKGLFVKETTIGDLKTGLAKVKNIDTKDHTGSYNNIDAVVDFNESFTPKVNYKQNFMGYSAYYIQPAIQYMDDNARTQFLDQLAKFTGKETVVKSTKMSGDKNTDVLINPLVIESVIETPQFIENAGNKYLFKVGELIGPQEELYQDKKRQTDGEISYNHSYTRNIQVKIPAGYKIKNPEAVKIEKKYMLDGKAVSSFISNYTMDGDKMNITIYEDYQVLFYPKEKYEEWKAVVNASADFNKVILIFEKL